MMLNEYINTATITKEFVVRILIIVAASWGIIFMLDKIFSCIWPSVSDIILKTDQPIDIEPSIQPRYTERQTENINLYELTSGKEKPEKVEKMPLL